MVIKIPRENDNSLLYCGLGLFFNSRLNNASVLSDNNVYTIKVKHF